jgi:regulator of RNase E activity RraA
MHMAITYGTRPETSAELIAAFKGLATPTIGNVLDDLGLGGIGLNLRPVAAGMRFVGAALTVKEVTGAQHAYKASEFGLGAVVDMCRPLDVVVIDNGGQQVSTWGGVASVAAVQNGTAGLVVDGGVRDADEIAELGVPVFSRHVVPLSGKTRVKVIEINTTVKIDGMAVHPGDIVVGDASGLVVVPLAHAAEVARQAAELERQDRQASEEIRKGLSFTEALRKFAKL